MSGDRLRKVETREQADMIMVAASPDGVELAAEGTFAFDTVSNTMWVNHDGATGWQPYAEAIYGEIYTVAGGGVVTNAVGIGNKVQITIFDTNGESDNMTPDHANDHITVNKSGRYLVTTNFSASSANVDDYETIVYTNNGTVIFHNLHTHRSVQAGGSLGAFSVTGIAQLAFADTVEVWLVRNSGPAVARTLTFEHANLACLYIGP